MTLPFFVTVSKSLITKLSIDILHAVKSAVEEIFPKVWLAVLNMHLVVEHCLSAVMAVQVDIALPE